jgi:hypothetical protein
MSCSYTLNFPPVPSRVAAPIPAFSPQNWEMEGEQPQFQLSPLSQNGRGAGGEGEKAFRTVTEWSQLDYWKLKVKRYPGGSLLGNWFSTFELRPTIWYQVLPGLYV